MIFGTEFIIDVPTKVIHITGMFVYHGGNSGRFGVLSDLIRILSVIKAEQDSSPMLFG